MKEFFCENRKQLADIMENESAIVLFAGNAPIKRGDEKYPFSPDRNFYYMTGLDCENAIYSAYKKDGKYFECVYIEREDPVSAKWTGETLKDYEVGEISGIQEVKFIDEFDKLFSGIMFNKGIKTVYLDLENREMTTVFHSFSFAEKIIKNYPYASIKNCYSVFSQMRRIKRRPEIEKIKKAIDITKEGIFLMMKNVRAGVPEYELEAYFDFAVKKGGASDFAFKSIIAGGKNATVLHYSENRAELKDGDLVLTDVGAQFEYYNGDITRTFPVNGKFTERQKVIYDIVLRGQKKIIESIKPGIYFKSLNDILIEFYLEELKKIGLISEDGTEDNVSEYYYHSVSHFLGLETHDVGRHNEGILEPGMVFTVEPGLYIEKENIGIRIEDNVLVTKDGCEVLSGDIIKEISEIEKYMGG